MWQRAHWSLARTSISGPPHAGHAGRIGPAVVTQAGAGADGGGLAGSDFGGSADMGGSGDAQPSGTVKTRTGAAVQ